MLLFCKSFIFSKLDAIDPVFVSINPELSEMLDVFVSIKPLLDEISRCICFY